MSWLSTGTAKVVNGNTRVEFAGVDLIANGVQAGDAFAIRGSFNNEIARIVSATALELVYPWIAASADAAAYTIQPTVARLNDLNTGVGELLRAFTDVRDLAGRGMFSDGSVATPGVRFINDQDTGIARVGPNVLALVVAGLMRMQVQPDIVSVQDVLNIAGVGPSLQFSSNVAAWSISTPVNTNALVFTERQFGSEKMRIDAAGNLLVGTASASAHALRRNVVSGQQIIGFGPVGGDSHRFYAAGQGGASGALTCYSVDKNGDTQRSINAAGTVNASGADYAEYMIKAAGCGIIAKGDVCGVDRDGRLTKTWADAISFVIKSTDPSLVGGDTWDAEVGPKPEEPGAAPAEPSPPAPPAEDADDAAIAAWRDAMAAYPAEVASYQVARAEWQKATDAYVKALPVWEAAHEKARQCVDRIAFCGQVPANVDGDFEVGDYIIAAASGAGIKAVAVKADDMTLPQYMRRIGKVWAVRDGRAWIDVQHG